MRRLWHSLARFMGILVRRPYSETASAGGGAPVYAGLEDVARALESVQHPRLSPQARERIWRTAVERSGRSAAHTRARRVLMRPSWVAIPLAIILISSSFGVVAAAQDSLPNQPLYRVKRISEQVWFSVTSESRRPAVALELLLRRFDEVERLAEMRQPIPAEVVDNIGVQLRWVLQARADEIDGERALERIDYHMRVLARLSEEYPQDAALTVALAACERVRTAVIDDLDPPEEHHTSPIDEPTLRPTIAVPTETRTPRPTVTPPIPTPSVPSGGFGTPTVPADPTLPPVVPPAPTDQAPPGHTPPGQILTPPGLETPPGHRETPPGQGNPPGRP